MVASGQGKVLSGQWSVISEGEGERGGARKEPKSCWSFRRTPTGGGNGPGCSSAKPWLASPYWGSVQDAELRSSRSSRSLFWHSVRIILWPVAEQRDLRGNRAMSIPVSRPPGQGSVFKAVFIAIAIQAILVSITTLAKLRVRSEDTDIYLRDATMTLEGKVPYRDFRVEYPPFSVPLFLAAKLVSRGVVGFQGRLRARDADLQPARF